MIRVLVVDDSPIIRQSLRKTIERYNDTTIVSGEAANGVKALEWLETHHADVCMTDIKMPAMNGLDLIDAINGRYPWMMTMVISSYEDFKFAQQSIKLKATDYILKPIEEIRLYEALGYTTGLLAQRHEKDAASLLVQKLPQHRKLIGQWVELLKTARMETMPTLIIDTLEVLEAWVGGHYYLLTALSSLWVHTVYEEMQDHKLHMPLEERNDPGLGYRALPRDHTRFYFRLCAVHRLEEGAHRLSESMRGIRDEQAVRFVEEIKQHIKEQRGKSIVLQQLADLICLNKTYMCTLFKQETDMTIGSYIVAERMNTARNLLVESSDKVYEIANAVGYEDVNYFTQIFKKHYGLTPVDYRKRMVR